MPVEKLESKHFAVSHLAMPVLATGKRGLSFSCSTEVDAVVLCFSKGEPLTPEKIDLSEEDLRRLMQGAELQKKNYRARGIPRTQIRGIFSDFCLLPPEQVQVWAAVWRNNIEPVLYVPENPMRQICFVPLLYRVEQRRENQFCCFTVKMSEPDLYENGALCYQVGDHLPIPIPQDCIDKEICVESAAGESIGVIVGKSYQEKYQRI